MSAPESAPHRFEVRVYYEDTDFSGFVYHANYLRFMERARTEFLRALGIVQSAIHRDEAGLVFVVARLKIDYQRPARMDDVLAVETAAIEARGPLVRLKQVVKRGDETLVSGEITVVAVRDGRAARLPPGLKAAFDASSRRAAHAVSHAAPHLARAPGQAE